MASAKLLFVALVALCVTPAAAFIWLPHNLNLIGHGSNGGTDCAGCTLMMAMISQYSELHQVTPMAAMDALCSFLPSPLPGGCKLLASDEGAGIAKMITAGETPDVICHSLKDPPCGTNGGPMCHLFPLPSGVRDTTEYVKYTAGVRRRMTDVPATRPVNTGPVKDVTKLKKKNGWFCKYFAAICVIIDKFGDDHLPLVDLDGDGFSTEATFRGTDWRGKDCADAEKEVYPGRQSSEELVQDENCNGIWGVDGEGRSYEEMWCKDTASMGSIIFGDSAAAHFHLPPYWFNVTDVGPDSYKFLFSTVENEVDWPMLSYTTGHYNSTKWNPTILGPMNSNYINLAEINKCNHRDYQNVGVNGASSRNVADFARYFSRNTQTDKPAMVTLALIGNDVCSGSPDVSSMTTPEEYYANMKSMIEMIDSRVPMGSVLVTIGLADGRILWDAMWNRIHPIGALHNDVTYQDLYAYLNCLDVSPCSGWMNSNATIRNATSAHAALLTKTLGQLVKDMTGNTTNVKLVDLGDFMEDVIETWVAEGNPAWELIEPMDGFHPNQIGNSLLGGLAWKTLSGMGITPPMNPHNADIQKKFGDQGGY